MSTASRDARLVPGVDARTFDAFTSNTVLLDAVERVERHRFVPPTRQMLAYIDSEISLGQGRRCPAPSAVVQLIDAAQLDDRAVACMWAGSGYVAAVLASMGLTVHAVESALPLRQMAMDALSAIGLAERVVWYDDVESVPASTVQAAIVCAAMNRFPRQLLSRLPQDGRLVVPIQRGRQAVISVITRQGHGHRRHDRPAVQMLSLDGAPMRR